MASTHIPVLAQRCLELLTPAISVPGAVMIDATLGLGGHSEMMLRAHPQLTVIGIDRDPRALELASNRLAPFGERFRPVHTTYDRINEVVDACSVDGILMDLGVSSMQLDDDERGFTYARNAPLDMRMNQESGTGAAELLATASAQELVRILREYGEERQATRIVRAIVKRREVEPLKTTGELVELIRSSLPQALMRTGGNPAKRTFQALRIAVNGELEGLRRALPHALGALRTGGRLAVESYHSLEDRMVKQEFAKACTDRTPPGLPVLDSQFAPDYQLLTRGAEKADVEEIESNPRSASVRLRAVARVSGCGVRSKK